MIQITFKTLKRIVKNFLHLPVTRVEVLKHAKDLQSTGKYPGLCALLEDALDHYGIFNLYPSEVFPKFCPKYVRQFGALPDYNTYWWDKNIWVTGRLDFLNWLIEQYKDDKTNIRKL